MKTRITYLAGSLALMFGMFGVCRSDAQATVPSAAVAISTSAFIVTPIRAVNGYFSVLTQRMAADRTKAMNVDRQQHIISDTDKLLGLATDLHQQMQGDREMAPNDLSRRAAEIERLAREVQDRMKSY